jgi:2-C-methyl-D-erythritol 2,4-cyclodiphosphate synthase
MIRVGQGFDAHAFDASRPLVLGGVTIPGAPGLAGHSDADVLAHAVSDALLGAAKLGDLGTHFPASPRWSGASSIDILSEVGGLLERDGWRVGNVDATVIAEKPRLGAHTAGMATLMAEALGVEPGMVSVKATTSDGMGSTGRAEGIAALATVLIERDLG